MTTIATPPGTASIPTTPPGTPAESPAKPRLLKQPAAVWAVAFAAMLTFMGIGVVGPVLPDISAGMNATPSQTSLLFSSYLVVTAIMMFFSSWVSSRIGTRNTMIFGLIIIAVAAVGCALSGDMTALISFRALWGLGNAMFLSTALTAIIVASGGKADHAIILYEAALGLGLAIGPLTGGILGQYSWSSAFWGTASLLIIGVVALIVFVRTGNTKPPKYPVSAPFRALSRPAILVLSIVAFLYNSSFFVTMAYIPYPLELSALNIGIIMTGFGLGLAFVSIAGAPWLTRRFSVITVLTGSLVVFALTHIAAGLVTDSLPGLIACIILMGCEIGLLNTVLTEAVMESTDLPRAIASSAYSGVRFFGGAIGAPVGTGFAIYGAGVPFWFAAATALLAAVVLLCLRPMLMRATQH